MVTPPRKTDLRRLKLEELISKIAQIEEQVSRTLDEFPHGHTLERQRLVLAIAKQVRSHLADQLRAGQRVAIIPDDSDARPLRVVDGEKRNASNQS
jgi:molybdopterin converting factor small subunit